MLSCGWGPEDQRGGRRRLSQLPAVIISTPSEFNLGSVDPDGKTFITPETEVLSGFINAIDELSLIDP